MKNRKNSPILFGITLGPTSRTGDADTDLEMRGSADGRKNTLPGKTEPEAIHEFDFSRRTLPTQGKPFTPDMFTCTSTPKRTFPPRKMTPEEKRFHRAQEHYRSRTATHYTSGTSTPMVMSAAWELFKVVCAGVFVALKYTFIAIALIITVGCMMCAGRTTKEVKYRW